MKVNAYVCIELVGDFVMYLSYNRLNAICAKSATCWCQYSVTLNCKRYFEMGWGIALAFMLNKTQGVKSRRGVCW